MDGLIRDTGEYTDTDDMADEILETIGTNEMSSISASNYSFQQYVLNIAERPRQDSRGRQE